MSIIRQLLEKPWLTEPRVVVDLHDGRAFYVPKATLGLRVFLTVVTILFFMLIIAYGGRMTFEDWRPGPDSRLLWLNTIVLTLSSAAMHWALIGARRDHLESVRNGLLLGGLLAFVFLVGQVLAWRQLTTLDYFEITNPAIAFFYLITGLHALHLIGGIVAWGWTTVKALGQPDTVKIRQSLELCVTYWHFLLVVWLVLFALLFSGNDNLGFLLSICGLR